MPNTDRENPWSPWVSWHMPGTFAHPDAPAGGTGLGYSREVGPSGTDIHGGRTPDPHSPVGQKVTPWDAAVEYAKFELERARAQLFGARSWEMLRIVAEQALGPKSFGLGACYGIVKNPTMSVVGLLQLMRTLIEADLYERLTQRVTWKTMLKPGGGMGLPKLSDVGYLLAMQSGLMSIVDLKKSYETREALIANVEELIKHPIDGVGKMTEGIKAEYVEKWSRFRELQKHTDLKSQFEAGEIFGEVLMEVVMVVLTVISVGGAAVKLAAKVPQLARLAEVVKGARAARAGGVAEDAVEAAKGARKAQSAAGTAKDASVTAASTADIAASRRGVAQQFYKDAGWPDKRMENHLQGIDFNQPVEVTTIPKGTRVVQYQPSGSPVGNYFAPVGTRATELGIASEGKIATIYETTEPVKVLKSTAATIEDTWSFPGQSVSTSGGGTQFFTPTNSAFNVISL